MRRALEKRALSGALGVIGNRAAFPAEWGHRVDAGGAVQRVLAPEKNLRRESAKNVHVLNGVLGLLGHPAPLPVVMDSGSVDGSVR